MLRIAWVLVLCAISPVLRLVNGEVAPSAVLNAGSGVPWGAPCLIEVENQGFYSFATTNQFAKIPIAYSKDFSDWNLVRDNAGNYVDALPDLPKWVKTTQSAIWGPDVNLLDNGTFIMYFAAVGSDAGVHCIGAAYSDSITGPYTGLDEPWYCPTAPDQTIDPDGFHDPVTGKRYVTFKWNQASLRGESSSYASLDERSNSNPCGTQGPPWAPTPITLQEVDQDGITKIGANYTLVDNNGAADLGNTESPSMMRNPQGHYVLFFSTGCFLDSTYTVSYAVSTGDITGPYIRHPEPLFDTGEYNLVGPGCLDVLNTGLYTVFFSHNPSYQKPANARKMRTALIDVIDTTVFSNGTLSGANLGSPTSTTSSSAVPTSSTGSMTGPSSNPTTTSGSHSNGATPKIFFLGYTPSLVYLLIICTNFLCYIDTVL